MNKEFKIEQLQRFLYEIRNEAEYDIQTQWDEEEAELELEKLLNNGE